LAVATHVGPGEELGRVDREDLGQALEDIDVAAFSSRSSMPT
jgi:hypothetical protein